MGVIADKQLVYNLRYKFGDKIKQYSDAHLVEGYHQFATSEDFPDEDKILLWLELVA